jgi:hypothetical protein
MAKRDEIFPSKYLKAADLEGKAIVTTIVSAPKETLKTPDGREDTKTVLYFRSAKKTLPLNRTNWDSVADICGDDTDTWPGCQIELYPTQTEMKGKVVDCIRIRAPAQDDFVTATAKAASPTKRPVKKPPSDDIDDVIPF